MGPMPTTPLKIATPDGTADATLYTPDGGGPFPGVLFFMDALGFRPSMHQMAQRLSAAGYAVLLPDLFYRAQPFAPFDGKAVWGNPDERARLMKLIASLDAGAARRDTTAYLDALAKQPGVRAGKLGCVGYCMGGRLAFTAAGTLPERVGAAASFHGGHLATDKPDSPHLHAPAIKAALYFGVADADPSCTLEHQQALASALQAAKVRYTLDFNPGVLHGWCVPDSPAFNEAAAERHWAHLLGFFGEALAR